MDCVIKWSEKTCLFCLRTDFLLPWERKFKNGTSRAENMTRPNKTQMFELLLNASECFLIEYVLVLRLKSIVLQRLKHLPDESAIILRRHAETHGLFRHVLNCNRINAYPKRFLLLRAWRYNSGRVLAFSAFPFHMRRSWTYSVHFMGFIFFRSFLTSSSHWDLGLPVNGFHLCIFFTILVSGILCPNQDFRLPPSVNEICALLGYYATQNRMLV